MHKIDKVNTHYTFEDLLEVMGILRGKDGCPWDLEQDHETLKDAAIEEAYELVEAINNKDVENLKEELGDLLLMVVFHSQIGSDGGAFTIDDVTDGIVTKMIRRHPHIFANDDKVSSDEVLDNWDQIKIKEKKLTTVTQDLRQVPKALPALIKSRKVQKKAAKVGFDFPSVEAAFCKVEEEVVELKEAIQSENISHIEEEMGDLLFSIVNISRFLDLNPENALTNALEKFINRFEAVESLAMTRNKNFSDMSLEEMDLLWDEVKKHEK